MSVAQTGGVSATDRAPPARGHDGSLPRGADGPPWHVAALHLTTLWSLAVAQPLFDVLADGPEFFVARGSERIDILILAFGLVLGPPAAMVAAHAALALVRPTLARALHSVLVALLVAFLAVQVLKRAEQLPAAAVLAGGVVVGAAVAWLYVRRSGLRMFLTVLSPAPVLFVVVFLTGPVGQLVWNNPSVAAPVRPIAANAPVIFVVLDELPVTSLMNPSGTINAARFPNFALLARGSTWFRQTTTVHGGTEAAVPALVTGRLPRDGRLPVSRNYPRNLFTLFGGSYRVDATESVTRLCPRTVCHRRAEPLTTRLRSLADDAQLVYLHALLPDGIALRLPHVTDTWVDFRADGAESPEASNVRLETLDNLARRALKADQRTQFASFIGRVRRAERPTLHYLHVALPHAPFRLLPSGRRYEVPPIQGLVDGVWWDDAPAAPRFGQQRHLLQLGLADRLLGRLLARLRAQQLYDEAAIVVVSDHGASFRPGEARRGVVAATLADLAFVPFFLKAPGQRDGRVVDRHVRTLDVLPTLADALGVAVPWRFDGRSALKAGPPPPATVTLLDGDHVTGPYSALLRRRAQTIAEQARVFGTSGFDARFYAVGGHASLVGTATRALPRRDSDLSVEVERPSDSLAWAAGRLDGPGAEGIRIAVAIDGRIAGTTTTYPTRDGVVFALMLSPAVRASDAADLQVYRIRERPLRLEELRQP